MQYQFRISGKHHTQLYSHVFPGDEKEAVAIALCGYHINGQLTIITVHEIFCIPYVSCKRTPDYVYWKTESIIHVLEDCAKKGLSFIKIHSHPTGYDKFSKLYKQWNCKNL